MTEQDDPSRDEDDMDTKLLAPEDVKTAKDFSRFMDQMADGFSTGEIEPQHVSEYLGGVAGAAHAIEGIAKNEGIDLPGPIDWKWMAIIMAVAVNHS